MRLGKKHLAAFFSALVLALAVLLPGPSLFPAAMAPSSTEVCVAPADANVLAFFNAFGLSIDHPGESQGAKEDPGNQPSPLNGGVPENEHETKVSLDRPLRFLYAAHSLHESDEMAPHVDGILPPGHSSPPTQPPDAA